MKPDGRSLKRKHPGTGLHDTPQATWDAMRAAIAKGGEPLTDIARRLGVLYSAAHTMASRWEREAQRPASPGQRRRVVQAYLAGLDTGKQLHPDEWRGMENVIPFPHLS